MSGEHAIGGKSIVASKDFGRRWLIDGSSLIKSVKPISGANLVDGSREQTLTRFMVRITVVRRLCKWFLPLCTLTSFPALNPSHRDVIPPLRICVVNSPRSHTTLSTSSTGLTDGYEYIEFTRQLFAAYRRYSSQIIKAARFLLRADMT